MPRLSNPISDLGDHYAVVIIGSGYGAAIAASRLARAGQKVCLLERGKEFQPGEYPDTVLEAGEEMQTGLPEGHVGPRSGLYQFQVDDDMNVFKGCGLGEPPWSMPTCLSRRSPGFSKFRAGRRNSAPM